MNIILKKLMEGASDTSSLAHSIADLGLRSVNDMFQGMKIFGALSVSTAEPVEYDETHYILVPLLGAKRDFAIYTKRVLPPDTGAINSLPKARVFHVPDETGRELLEKKLIEDSVNQKFDHSSGSSELADIFEKLADQIDRETNKVSGGLILIGGAVAFVNPLLGVGIVAKGMLPSIGAKVSKVGAEYVGNKFRHWNKSSAVSKFRKDTSKELKRLKPRVYLNPIVRSLDVIASNPETDLDPVFDNRNWVDEFESIHYYTVTEEAFCEVYKGVLGSLDLESYKQSHIQWIKSFVDNSDN